MGGDVSAVIQFEFSRSRVGKMSRKTKNGDYGAPHSAYVVAHEIIRASLQDTFDNGGTFVCVVSKDKITCVQRTEAEEIK